MKVLFYTLRHRKYWKVQSDIQSLEGYFETIFFLLGLCSHHPFWSCFKLLLPLLRKEYSVHKMLLKWRKLNCFGNVLLLGSLDSHNRSRQHFLFVCKGSPSLRDSLLEIVVGSAEASSRWRQSLMEVVILFFFLASPPSHFKQQDKEALSKAHKFCACFIMTAENRRQ